MNNTKILCFVVVIALSAGCATTRPAPPLASGAPPVEAFVITPDDLSHPYVASAGALPREHVRGAAIAWAKATTGGYTEAGESLLRAYEEGLRLGWRWEPETAAALLGHALRAFHAAGRVDLERPVARLLADELGGRTDLVPMEVRVLAFWATGEQAFASAVPPSVRLGLRGGSR